MKLSTAGEVSRLATRIGYRDVRIQRISHTDTGWAVFGVHPDGHRGRITQADLERTTKKEDPQ